MNVGAAISRPCSEVFRIRIGFRQIRRIAPLLHTQSHIGKNESPPLSVEGFFAGLSLIHGCGQVPLAGIGEEHYDGLTLVFFLSGQFQGNMEGAAGGDAAEDAFFPEIGRASCRERV